MGDDDLKDKIEELLNLLRPDNPRPPHPAPPEGPCAEYRKALGIASEILENFDLGIHQAGGLIKPSTAIGIMSDSITIMARNNVGFVVDYADSWKQAQAILNDLAIKIAGDDMDAKLARPMKAIAYGDETVIPADLMLSRIATIKTKFSNWVEWHSTHEETSPFGELTPGEIIEIYAKLMLYLAPKRGKGIFTQRSSSFGGSQFEQQPWADYTYTVLMKVATSLHGVPAPAPNPQPGGGAPPYSTPWK